MIEPSDPLIADLRQRFRSLPRPDLIGERPSSEEFQLWVGFAGDLLALLDDSAHSA